MNMYVLPSLVGLIRHHQVSSGDFKQGSRQLSFLLDLKCQLFLGSKTQTYLGYRGRFCGRLAKFLL